MKTSKRIQFGGIAALLAVLGLILQPAALLRAADSSYQTVVYLERTSGLLKDQAGGAASYNARFRTSIANVNTGVTLLPALPGYKYRLIDLHMIAVGGAVATCTSVDILATQATASVKLVSNAVAALTQSALLRAGASNSTILADGVSFVQNDVNTAITIGKTGASCATATNVDVNITYSIDQ